MNGRATALIGQPVDRAEDLRFLTGAGKYVDDLQRDGMLHAVLLRSGVAHGRIRSLDTSAALAMKGVHGVITAAEIGGQVPVIPLRLANLPEFKPYLQPVIAREKVRYVGEPLAVVVAESQPLAEDALEAIEVEIESLPAVPDRACGDTQQRRCCSTRPAATAPFAIASRSAMPMLHSARRSIPAGRAFAVTA